MIINNLKITFPLINSRLSLSLPHSVSCSDGSGRSGTYILVDMVLNKMAKGGCCLLLFYFPLLLLSMRYHDDTLPAVN